MIEKSFFTTALQNPLNFPLDDDLKDSITNFVKSLSVSRCFSPVILEDIFMEKDHLDLACFSSCVYDRIFGD